MPRTNKVPKNFSFDFVAIDGRTYPVTVEFLARLPATVLVASRMRQDWFRNRAALHLHSAHPRCRMIVTVDSSTIDDEFARIRGLADTLDQEVYDELNMAAHQRSHDFRHSVNALVDQLYVALQIRSL